MKVQLIVSLFLLTSINNFAQDASDSRYQAAKEQNSSESATSNSISVNESEGKLSYYIPIADLKMTGFTLPLGLVYSYDGFQPSQESSWIGHGWEVSGIGSIDRQVNGLPDELFAKANGEFPFHESIYDYRGYLLSNRSPASLLIEPAGGNASLTALSRGQEDLQPDFFKLNTGASQASFILARNEVHKLTDIDEESYLSAFIQPEFFPSENSGLDVSFGSIIKDEPVEYSSPTIDGFKYTNDQMIEFNYGESLKTEVSKLSGDDKMYSYPTSPFDISSKWLIQNVQSKRDDSEITVDYHPQIYYDNKSLQSAYYYMKVYSGNCSLDQNSGFYKEAELYYQTELKFPKEINAENGRVEFILSADVRLDEPLLPKLSSIKIYNAENVLIKIIDFEYVYLGSTNQRMLLKKILFKSGDGEIIDWKEFEYNINLPDGLDDDLPVYETGAVDFWGFANGSDAPYFPLKANADLSLDNYTFSNPSLMNDGRPNLEYTKIGALKKVLNKGGGVEAFEYELNSGNYSNEDDVIQSIRDLDNAYQQDNLGGLRLLEHVIESGNGDIIRNRYKYSPGQLVSNLNYIETMSYFEGVNPVNDHWIKFHSSHNAHINSFTKQTKVFYDEVEKITSGINAEGEEDFSDLSIGRTISKYSFHPEYSYYPHPARIYPDWRNGNLKEIISYDINNPTEEIYHKILNYNFELDGSEIPAYKFGKTITNHSEDDNKYILQSEFYYLQSTAENIRRDDGSWYSVETQYEYDSKLLKSTTTILPDNSEIKVITKYNHEYPTATNLDFNITPATKALSRLRSKGFFALPIETATFIKSGSEPNYKLRNATINIYQLADDPNDVPNLKEILNTNLEIPLEGYEMSTINPPGGVIKYFEYETGIFETTTINSIVDLDDTPLEIINNKGLASNIIRESVNTRIIAKTNKSELAKTRYTSFEIKNNPEEYELGGWELNYTPSPEPCISVPSYPITGDHSFCLSLGVVTSGSSTNLPKGKYLLSFWHKGSNVSIIVAGGTDTPAKEYVEGEWTYKEVEIEITANFGCQISLSGSAFIDELRLHEIDASMETMGYYPDGKIKYKSSPSGDVITYEYDSKGRLEWVLNRKRNVIEHHSYEEKNITDENSYNKHIVSSALKENIQKSVFDNIGMNNDDVKHSISFSDGMGRVRQSIHINTDYNNRDAVQVYEYDSFGREITKYLPYWTTGLDLTTGYIQTAKLDQLNYYSGLNYPHEATDSPFAKTEIEASPLQRPIQKGGVGDELQLNQGHSTSIEYGWNDVNDHILKWTHFPSTRIATSTEEYAANELKKTTTTSPDGKVSITFVDASGRTVASTTRAKVSQDTEGNSYSSANNYNGNSVTEQVFTSYMVYDDFGQVIYEISAAAIEQMDGTYSLNPSSQSQVFDELIYYFEYDHRGRVTTKHTPGQGRSKFVFDQKDRLIMSQDAQQLAEGKWSFVKRDTRGRVIIKGEFSSTTARAAHQTAADASTDIEEIFEGNTAEDLMYYTNIAYPILNGANDVLNVYYFDNYDFNSSSGLNFIGFNGVSNPMEVTRGMATGSRTRILNPDGTPGSWLTTVSYYDTESKPIQSFTENHRGGFDRIDTYYTEFNQVERIVQHHKYKTSSSVHTFTTRYKYIAETGQLQNTYCQIDSDPEILVSNRYYNQMGQLVNLKLHRKPGTDNYMQYINYRYNAQGQLTHINDPSLVPTGGGNSENDDVFGQQLVYFDLGGDLEYSPSNSYYQIIPRYDGNIAAMLWNAKTPDEDATTLSQNAYIYHYDDFGQMSAALYAADDPSFPGEYNQNTGTYNELVEYNLGGRIKEITRNTYDVNQQGVVNVMDDLSYSYLNGGYRLESVEDNGLSNHSQQYKHFVDGASLSSEYTYDAVGRTLEDKNRNVTFYYNRLGLPRRIVNNGTGYWIEYMYDAAGNKLQKFTNRPECPPDVLCTETPSVTTDYIGNFVYEDDELKMIYHPEGVIRPTPSSADNETEYVYDYFIKDYLGNVRVVLTEENATYTEKFLATMELVHRQIEEDNFDNIEETDADLPLGYPVDGSVDLNEKIALLSAANGTEIGPNMVLPVRLGDKVSLSTNYFYTEDAAGATYDNFNLLVNEVLIALAASGAGVLNLNETQLVDIATGTGNYSQAVSDFMSSNFDTTDVQRPHAYLVWMLYDNGMKLIPEGSGAIRVTDPNELRTILQDDIEIRSDGYLHAYVTNGSAKSMSFDNILVSYLRGKTRQINHYYPYGLSISGLGGDYDEYLNKYTSKELQTGEFDPSLSTGLEMFDFHARFYDPQLGRWFTPDPAEQFSNPYLAMGNNPVVFIDPDGEFVFLVVGAVVGAYIGGAMANDHLNPGKWDYSSGSTWAGMGVGAVVGAFGGHALAASKAGAVAAGGVAKGSGAAAKSATVFGKTMTKAAGKKYFGSTIGGLTNTISNYDGKDGFGWGTLGDFAAGFGGAYAGLSANSAAVGFNAGGFLNSTNNIAQDGFGSAVEFAQDWVGGGLSSMVGMKYGQFKGGFKPFNAEAKFGKFANKAVNSGFQANMWDFAYSDWEDYRKKGLDYHLTLFAGAGITAALTQTVMQPSSGFNSEYASGWQRVGESTGRGMWGYGSSLVEFNVASLIKSRQPYYSGGSQPNKAGILGMKWFLNLTY